jgi:hypothetical protein
LANFPLKKEKWKVIVVAPRLAKLAVLHDIDEEWGK